MDKTFSPKNLPDLQLSIMDLKGKPYMKVAQRLLWFVTEVKTYTIETAFPILTDATATASVTVTILGENGQPTRKVTQHKTETKKDFNDYAEKAETGALGRCLAALGYGTAQAEADLDEGTRIVDSPVDTTATAKPAAAAAPSTAPARKPSSFVKKPAPSNVVPITTSSAAPKAAEEDWGV